MELKFMSELDMFCQYLALLKYDRVSDRSKIVVMINRESRQALFGTDQDLIPFETESQDLVMSSLVVDGVTVDILNLEGVYQSSYKIEDRVLKVFDSIEPISCFFDLTTINFSERFKETTRMEFLESNLKSRYCYRHCTYFGEGNVCPPILPDNYTPKTFSDIRAYSHSRPLMQETYRVLE